MMQSGISSAQAATASLQLSTSVVRNDKSRRIRRATFRIELESSMIRQCFMI
jgi:hypothetical protein